MARLRRLVLPGHPHLVIQRASRAAPAFVDAADALLYRESLALAARDAGVAVHAFHIAPDEVRLLATPAEADGLARTLQSAGRRYVRGHNLRHGQTGSPWDGRFRSAVVEAPGSVVASLRFVEAPRGLDVESAAGFVASDRAQADAAAGPALSSLGHHLGRTRDVLVTTHPAFWSLGNTPFERESAYLRLVQQPLDASLMASILHAALHGWAVGSPAFLRDAEAQSGRRLSPAPRGRPKRRAAPTEAV